MNPLTADEMADVAREVTGRPHYFIDCIGMRGVFDMPEDELMLIKGILLPDHLWSPGFAGGWESNRDQALACVEWLCDKILKTPAGERPIEESEKLWRKVGMWMSLRRIDELQRMVLELKEPK